MAAEPKKEVKGYMNLKVLGHDNAVLGMKVRRCISMRKIMVVFAERMGCPINQLRFRFSGIPVTGSETPDSLGLEDGDTIEVYTAQMGGGGPGPSAPAGGAM